jgi:hypothetical protein
MMKIIGYIIVAGGFLWLFVFVVVAAAQVHFLNNGIKALPQAEMIERDLAITQMAILNRSWRQMCTSAQWPAIGMLFGAVLIGFGCKSKTQKDPQQPTPPYSETAARPPQR